MPTLLVVNRDDSYLPRGWVSAILPDGVAPSDYERSGYLWDVVEAPAEAPAKATCSGPSSFTLRALIHHSGEVFAIDSAPELLASRCRGAGAGTKTLPGPGHLDRSHSTVWDYGPGRTYSTPQAAFDALMAQEGGNDFTEAHYIRGWSGTYGQGPTTTVLAITTVSPSPRYPLVVDAAPAQSVAFNDEGGFAGVAALDVSHVAVRSLTIGNAYYGVVPVAQSTGGVVEDWKVEDSEIGAVQVGVTCSKTDLLTLRHCRLIDLGIHGVGSLVGWNWEGPARLEVSGCVITPQADGLSLYGEVSLVLVNNTIQATGSALQHNGGGALILVGMINNVFTAENIYSRCIRTVGSAPDLVKVMRSDANCFHPGAEGLLADLGGTALDLAGWREQWGQDARSLAVDPLLDEDFNPLAASPCRQAGVGWDDGGINGLPRTASIDLGAVQVTSSRVPGAIARREPEIGRR
jgi:hypothetical protein